jgi:integrase/recombinase XerD
VTPCNHHHSTPAEYTTSPAITHGETRTVVLGVRTATVHPRVHDLRHSFAVDTLIRWQQSGVDIGARIGILSTYLGHISPADTYWYLSASPQLMELAAQRLQARLGARQ